MITVVAAHSHPNEQMGIMISGMLEFTIGDETKVMKPGDVYRIPGGIVHSVRAFDEPVRVRVAQAGFDEGQNAEITWAHLLQQTSEWQGSCFGIPDQADRYRVLQFQGGKPQGRKGQSNSR